MHAQVSCRGANCAERIVVQTLQWAMNECVCVHRASLLKGQQWWSQLVAAALYILPFWWWEASVDSLNATSCGWSFPAQQITQGPGPPSTAGCLWRRFKEQRELVLLCREASCWHAKLRTFEHKGKDSAAINSKMHFCIKTTHKRSSECAKRKQNCRFKSLQYKRAHFKK